MLECTQLKVKIKDLVSKNRHATESELDLETLNKPIPKTENDVRTCIGTGMFDFGEETSSNSDEGIERDIGYEDFLNESY